MKESEVILCAGVLEFLNRSRLRSRIHFHFGYPIFSVTFTGLYNILAVLAIQLISNVLLICDSIVFPMSLRYPVPMDCYVDDSFL